MEAYSEELHPALRAWREELPGAGEAGKVWIAEGEGRQFVSSFDGAAFYCIDTGQKIH